MRTVVEAKADLGLGDALYIRGKGGSLSWERGQQLTWVGRHTWVWSSNQPEGNIVFQLVLNDQVWARGREVVLEAGKRMQVEPDFEWPEIPRTT